MKSVMRIAMATFSCMSLFSCTFTTTLPKTPVFRIENDSLFARIKAFVPAEHINISGSEVNTNGKKSSLLQITVINGENVPADTSQQLVTYAERIVSLVRSELKDQKAFDSYRMRFEVKKTQGATTSSSYVNIDFKKKDLDSAGPSR